MISLGIDPGIATTGYGVIKKEGDRYFCLDYGVIKTDKSSSDSRRLYLLKKSLSSIIEKYSPEIVSVEKLYFFKNIKTALPVSQAKGVIMVTIEEAHLPLQEFTPLEVKQSITGYGKAEKEQVQRMIQAILGLKEKPHPDDAADALGVAICGINKFTSPF